MGRSFFSAFLLIRETETRAGVDQSSFDSLLLWPYLYFSNRIDKTRLNGATISAPDNRFHIKTCIAGIRT
jgi:hypothetical protein